MKLPPHPPVDGGYLMSYHHLSMFERGRIKALHTLGYSTRQIAIQTGRHHSSIARGLVRNTREMPIEQKTPINAMRIEERIQNLTASIIKR